MNHDGMGLEPSDLTFIKTGKIDVPPAVASYNTAGGFYLMAEDSGCECDNYNTAWLGILPNRERMGYH